MPRTGRVVNALGLLGFVWRTHNPTTKSRFSKKLSVFLENESILAKLSRTR